MAKTIKPRNYADPPKPSEPTQAEIDADYAETRDLATNILDDAGPKSQILTYDQVVKEMQKQGKTKFLTDPQQVLEDLDKAWNPAKFEPKTAPIPPGMMPAAATAAAQPKGKGKK